MHENTWVDRTCAFIRHCISASSLPARASKLFRYLINSFNFSRSSSSLSSSSSSSPSASSSSLDPLAVFPSWFFSDASAPPSSIRILAAATSSQWCRGVSPSESPALTSMAIPLSPPLCSSSHLNTSSCEYDAAAWTKVKPLESAAFTGRSSLRRAVWRSGRSPSPAATQGVDGSTMTSSSDGPAPPPNPKDAILQSIVAFVVASVKTAVTLPR
mmetsp:Transcript_55505/g.166421  ORF Transcript_55505/g.166421 Transcript_55505/m.166421 type:complete len:214 (+) Transcript_55505:633-1274(+)